MGTDRRPLYRIPGDGAVLCEGVAHSLFRHAFVKVLHVDVDTLELVHALHLDLLVLRLKLALALALLLRACAVQLRRTIPVGQFLETSSSMMQNASISNEKVAQNRSFFIPLVWIKKGRSKQEREGKNSSTLVYETKTRKGAEADRVRFRQVMRHVPIRLDGQMRRRRSDRVK